MSDEKNIFDENKNGGAPEVIHAESVENAGQNSGEDIAEAIVPAISPPGVIVFPFALTPLVLDNAEMISLVEKAVTGEDRLIAIFPEMPDPNTPAADIQGMGLKVKDMELDGKKVSTVGVLCRIVKVLKFPDGTVRMLLRGLNRVGSSSRKNSVFFSCVKYIFK